MLTVEITYSNGKSERAEVPLERTLQDLRTYFADTESSPAERVEVLKISRGRVGND